MIRALLAMWILSGVCAAADLKLNARDSTVEFTAIGKPSMLKIKGKDARPEGVLRNGLGKIVIRLDEFNTGLSKRDAHMKEQYLETGKYPQAILEILRLNPSVTFKEKAGSYKGKWQGNLTLHGVTKPAEGALELTWQNSSFQAVSSFSLQLSDYAIKVPSFAGVTVANSIDVSTHAAGSLTP